MFIVILFIIVRESNKAKCTSTDKWLMKTQYICTMYRTKFHSAIKKNEIVKFSENGTGKIILNKVTSTSKVKQLMVILI